MKPIIYVCHPFGGKSANLDRAEHWCAQLSLSLPAFFVAPWVPLCRYWPNDGDTLTRGISLDLAAIAKCDALVAVGGKMSVNGRREFDASRNPYDLSEFTDFDTLLYDSNGHTWDMFFGWIREMSA